MLIFSTFLRKKLAFFLHISYNIYDLRRSGMWLLFEVGNSHGACLILNQAASIILCICQILNNFKKLYLKFGFYVCKI